MKTSDLTVDQLNIAVAIANKWTSNKVPKLLTDFAVTERPAENPSHIYAIIAAQGLTVGPSTRRHKNGDPEFWYAYYPLVQYLGSDPSTDLKRCESFFGVTLAEAVSRAYIDNKIGAEIDLTPYIANNVKHVLKMLNL